MLSYFIMMFVIGSLREWTQYIGVALHFLIIVLLFLYWFNIAIHNSEGSLGNSVINRVKNIIFGLLAFIWMSYIIAIDVYNFTKCYIRLRKQDCKKLFKSSSSIDKCRYYANCILYNAKLKVNSYECLSNFDNLCK